MNSVSGFTLTTSGQPLTVPNGIQATGSLSVSYVITLAYRWDSFSASKA